MSRWWATLKHNGLQVTLALNQLLHVVLALICGFRGWADETLSSRTWRSYEKRKVAGLIFRPVIDALFFWQTVRPDAQGHCHHAFLNERDRLGSPPEHRT
jgi:hypothetical protein